jgi:hypothetical protein
MDVGHCVSVMASGVYMVGYFLPFFLILVAFTENYYFSYFDWMVGYVLSGFLVLFLAVVVRFEWFEDDRFLPHQGALAQPQRPQEGIPTWVVERFDNQNSVILLMVGQLFLAGLTLALISLYYL